MYKRLVKSYVYSWYADDDQGNPLRLNGLWKVNQHINGRNFDSRQGGEFFSNQHPLHSNKKLAEMSLSLSRQVED